MMSSFQMSGWASINRLHQGDAFRIVQQYDFDAALTKEILIPTERAVLTNDDFRYPELNDGTGAHHAGT
jgi:hypothetical protein